MQIERIYGGKAGMSFDGGFCRAVSVKLKELLQKTKIEKIHNPERDKFIFSIYSPKYITVEDDVQSRHVKLIVSINPSAPHIFIGNPEGDNPSNPSPFCMLLRKHLTSAIITDIFQVGYDRIIMFEFSKRNELGYEEKKYLSLEMMGKYSNAFLLNGEMKILGCAKTADLTESKRLTLTGAKYETPQQDKIDPTIIDDTKFLALVTAAENIEKRADSFLLQTFSGFSPLISREVVYRASGVTDTPLGQVDTQKLWSCFCDVVDAAKGGGDTPCVVLKAGGGVAAYSFTNLTQYFGLEKRTFEDVLSLQSAVIQTKTGNERMSSKKRELSRLLNAKIAKLEKILALRRTELSECNRMNEYKHMGDLITASMYKIKQGQSVVELPDYESGENVRVTLDPKLSPSANAQRYYKKYRKLRHAEVKQKELIAEAKSELEYFESVAYALSKAETERELEDIREELAAEGCVSQRKQTRVQKTKKSEPLKFTTSGGFVVRVGKNNLQNDKLTFSADKNDIWFHVKDIPGSHVILYTRGEEPSELDYTEAAEIAAWYSKAQGAPNTAVDYTRRKFVKKPSGAKPGFVTYDKYYTAIVSPNEEKIAKLSN